MRVRIDLAYDGSDFHGWAAQPDLRTVQGELEQALGTLLRMPVDVTCAGRTDTGVHARGQVVHVDLPEDQLATLAGRSSLSALDALTRRLGGLLPPDIRVHRVGAAHPDFDARFAALSRSYVFRIADQPATADPLHRNHVLWWPRPLDEAAMAHAAPALVGEHDFIAFCKRREGATTIRTVLSVGVARTDQGTVEIALTADAFCHHMVRAIVGALVEVGEGRRTTDWFAGLVARTERQSDVPVVPARGLTLERVDYPPDEELAARVGQARAKRGEP